MLDDIFGPPNPDENIFAEPETDTIQSYNILQRMRARRFGIELLALRDTILNDPQAALKHSQNHHKEAHVQHRTDPNITLVAAFQEVSDKGKRSKYGTLGILDPDGSGMNVRFNQDTLHSWNVHEDEFTAFIMDSFRSHVQAIELHT